MRYRLLGNSGLRVSTAALGTMTFGDDWGWGAAKGGGTKGVRRFPRGRRQFHRHSEHNDFYAKKMVHNIACGGLRGQILAQVHF